MAKPTAPLLSFDASGTIAKTQVYSRWKGRSYVRRHVIPANPNTTAQQATRNVFSTSSAIWKQGPSLLTEVWNLFATGQVLTGRNAFIGSYTRNLRSKTDFTDFVFSPSAKGGLAPLTITVTAGSTNLSVAMTVPAPPTGWTLAASVAAAIPNGNPATTTAVIITAGTVVATPWTVLLTGLIALQEYRVGAWLKWTKPDTSTAYGASISTTGTPTA